MPSGLNSRSTRQRSSPDFCNKAHVNMGAKHALLSLVYLVGAALIFSLARAEFWQGRIPEADPLEHHDELPDFASSVT